MRDVVKTRGSWFLAVLAVGFVLVPEVPVEAQARRDGRRPGGLPGFERPGDLPREADTAARQRAALIGKDRDTGFTFGQAPADRPSPFSAFQGTTDNQIRRYRGDNNEFNFEVGPSGRSVGNLTPSGAGGFTIDRVHEGYYMPGFGVNNGFAAPERVHGGFYTPGWGVMGGVGDFNGPAATQQLRGGTYIPGFGVGGGPAVSGAGGPAGIVNQSGPAILGNFGNPAVGASPSAGSTPVAGGSYVPGFGVSGGR